MRFHDADTDTIEEGAGNPKAYVVTLVEGTEGEREGWLFLDGRRKRNVGASINHSHEPNAEMYVVRVPFSIAFDGICIVCCTLFRIVQRLMSGMPQTQRGERGPYRVLVKSTRDIEKEEEITIHYGWKIPRNNVPTVRNLSSMLFELIINA
jgi:SET domain-containing protein